MKRNILILIGLIFLHLNLYSETPGDLPTDTISLDEIVISGSYTAVKETPFTFLNLDRRDIQEISFNEEPSIILTQTPSFTFHSDNGLGLGYSYFRLRGIDQTRINTSLNGIPLNEPEDQGVYFNNYFNFLLSIQSVQIIRGAGLSKPGISSYGGSINFQSLDFSDRVSGFANITLGSYNTISGAAGINSPRGFLILSYGNTEGYKRNSFNQSYSTFYGANRDLADSKIYLYGFIGAQVNGMAWLGEPIEEIYANPQYNSNTDDETDRFTQVHNQVKWVKGGLSLTGYHTYLKGWYDMDMAHFDQSKEFGDLFFRLNLQSNWIGTVANYNIRSRNITSDFGVSSYYYYRDHAGRYSEYSEDEPWYYSYDNTGYRREFSPYAKSKILLGPLSVYGDIQWRYTDFRYEGLEEFPGESWSFINWSTGISYNFKRSQIYWGLGRTNREPTRTDLFGGEDDYIPEKAVEILPETALSNELGYKFWDKDFSLNVNLYYMDFSNEIVLNGQLGTNSISRHQNAAESFRSGIELDLKRELYNWEFRASGNVSYNRISQDGETLHPVLSPPVIGILDIRYKAFRSLYVGFNSRYNSRSYIDFSNQHTLPSYAIHSIYGGISIGGLELRGRVNNITDELILGSGIVSYGTPYYFVMAGINYSVSLNFKF